MKGRILYRRGVKAWVAIQPLDGLPEWVEVQFYCEPLPGGIGNPVYTATVRIPAEHREEAGEDGLDS